MSITVLVVAVATLVTLAALRVRLVWRRFTLKDLFILTALAALLALLVGIGNRRLAAIPKPIHQPFNSWSEAWVTPPLAAGKYWISLEYARREPGRLGVPIKLKLFDETADEAVPNRGDRVGGKGGSEGWDKEIVGEFAATEGHRYRIEVDPAQVRALGRYHHRLTVNLTIAETENRMMKAFFE